MERSYTTVDEHHIFYEWEIDKVNTYWIRDSKINDFTLNSPEFSTGAKIKDRWWICLKICNPSTSERYSYSAMIFDLYCSNHTKKINIKYSSFILNNKKNKEFKESEQHCLLSENERRLLFIKLDSLMKERDTYFTNNTFTFCLDLTVYDYPFSTSKKLALNIPINQMAHDYTELYNTKIGSDVIINVRNTEFRAHKTILMARSPVFAAMFFHNMIEKKENKISIPDITPEVFEKLLKYIYTDEVNDLDANAQCLLEAADKYQLQSLKKMCQVSLSKTLTVNNALKIMTLADRHSAKDLLEFTNKFMASNIKKIIETQNFKELKISNPPLAFELLEKFSFLNL